MAILGSITNPPKRIMAATANTTQSTEVTTTFHSCFSSAKSMVVPMETISIPTTPMPMPETWASLMMVWGRIPDQNPASRITEIPSTVERIARVFMAISSLTA